MSQCSSSRSSYHDPRPIDHLWPSRPHYPSRNASKSDATLDSPARSNSAPQCESLVEMGALKTSRESRRGSTRSSHSASSSDPLLRAGSSRETSHPTSLSQTLPRSEQRPGKIRNLGIFGLYHHNPRGLAGHYDWEAEDGGYIPYQYQGAHRRRWRREMRKAQKEEQRERAAKFESVEEKKAARRRAYEEHLAARGNVSSNKESSSTKLDGQADADETSQNGHTRNIPEI